MKKLLTLLLALTMALSVCCAVSVAEEPTTLTMLSWWSETQMADTVAGFEAAYPEYKIEVQYAAPINDYITRFQALQATGELPDIWATAAENRLDVFNTEYAADLGELLNASGLAKGNIERYTDDNGRVVAYAPTSWVSGLAYNKDMLTENGLEVPTDWESWLNCVATLEANGVQAIAMDPGAVSDFAGMTVGATTVWNDPEYDNKVNKGELKYADGWTDALKLWYDTYIATGYFHEEALGISGDDAMNAFLLGDACFRGCATWNVDTVNESADFEWGLIPYFGPDGAAIACGAVTVGWSVNATSPNAEGAMKWIEYLLSDDGAARFYSVTGGILNIGAEYELDERLLELADLFNQGHFYLSQVEFKFSDAISSIVNAGTLEIMMGTASIEDVVGRMDAKYAELSAN